VPIQEASWDVGDS